MRYFIDTEFSERPGHLELLSIGIVCEDGRQFYAENSEFDVSKCNDWMKENVLPKLTGPRMRKQTIAERMRRFVSGEPEFWGYYSDYDWVVFCWLFGAMIDLPEGWPMYCRDLKQEIDRLGLDIHQPEDQSHNALDDARWIRETWGKLPRRTEWGDVS